MLGKLVRPDINTKFRVDYDWWAERNGNIRMLIREQLCTECKEKFGSDEVDQDIDWVDPSTGEVTVVDGLRYALRDCCSRREDYIARSTPLTAAIFRALIADDDTPLSATEIHERIGRSDPKTLLRILLGEGMRTHYGVRPILG
jgi:hypothetical protein